MKRSLVIFVAVLALVHGSDVIDYLKQARIKDPDLDLDTPQLIKKNGYPAEVHMIYTKDGYLLALHRIPHGKKERPHTPNKIPVLLQHGLTSSSIIWVFNGVEHSLGFLLADAGYDVWMGNVRGNQYSRLETATKDPNTKGYWKYSWHECGIYDIPAMIDHILLQTEQEKLFYIGHSMGTTMFYVMTSQRPQYNDKIRAMFSFAPMAFMSHLTSPFVRQLSSSTTPVLLKDLGVNEFLPEAYELENMLNRTCHAAHKDRLCGDIVHIIYNYNKDNINAAILPYVLKHLPHGSSTNMFIHYVQEVASGKFAQFDHGPVYNILKYQRLHPHLYNLTKITAPVSLHYGDTDLLVSLIDVKLLFEQLPTPVGLFRVPQKGFTHVDFIAHFNATNILYKPIMRLMKKY